MIRSNSRYYAHAQFERFQQRTENEIYLVEVLSVDFERRNLTVRDIKDNLIYTDITVFPAGASSFEGYDLSMPREGAIGLACNYVYAQGGYRQPMIISWVEFQSLVGIDAIAIRPITGDVIQGYSDRTRQSYRKAYPGQKTSSYPGGYAEKLDTAWDRQSADLTRDKQDSDKRQWTQIAGRKVNYTDAGVVYQGTVSRPTASALSAVTLPDGTKDYIAYLQPMAQPADRYVNGKPDVIPFSEHTELVQEFSLDYPVPFELLQTSLLDTLLGTTANPWLRTTVPAPQASTPAVDSQSFTIAQDWDDPYDDRVVAVGPAMSEGATPQRRGYIMERTAGTLVGYNLYDTSTYGLVLKPQLFVNTQQQPGKFGSSVESGYAAVVDSTDHIEARLAASCLAIRFPYDQNTTRLNVTKEGLVQMEIGSTLPKENILLQPKGGYEYPYGAGRSMEAHLVGSAKMVIGKNRDEEEALDIQALGQVVLRLGADDTSLPNARRTTETQIRSRNDLPSLRTMQYWDSQHVALAPGDAGNMPNWSTLPGSKYGASKVGAENVSLRGAFDGGTVLRLGAKDRYAKRRHLINGYIDAQGKNAYGVGDSNRQDSKSYRMNYAAGDSNYQFHDLTQAGAPLQGSFGGVTIPFPVPPYQWSGSPVTSTAQPQSPMDSHGQSLDLHAVRDILLRVGKNTDSAQSILLDTDGGIVFDLGTDNQGRSITGALEGGVEITIKPNKQGKAIRLNIAGDIDITHFGHLSYLCTGDVISEATTRRSITKTDNIETQMKKVSSSLAGDTRETYGDAVNSQPGAYEAYADENGRFGGGGGFGGFGGGSSGGGGASSSW